jgi:hypothetical protein
MLVTIFLIISHFLFSDCYQIKILNTAVLPYFKNLNFHHIVLLKKGKHSALETRDIKDVYIIDYTPKQQPDILGYIKLLMGHETPGIIRTVYIKKTNKENITNDWYNEVSKLKYKKTINDRKISNILKNWDLSFNLYSHNCQHFSEYFNSTLIH